MFIAMNRFKIALGFEEGFERVWRQRERHAGNLQRPGHGRITGCPNGSGSEVFGIENLVDRESQRVPSLHRVQQGGLVVG